MASASVVKERQARVNELLFTRGFSHGRIRRELSAEWGITEQGVGYYIAKAEGVAARDDAADPGLSKAQFREMVTTEIEEHKAAGELRTIPNLLGLLAKSQGLLDERVQVEHSGTIDHRVAVAQVAIKTLAPAELAQLEALLGKLTPDEPLALPAGAVKVKP